MSSLGGAETIDRRGLTQAEAEARLRRDGPNILPVPPGPSAIRQLVAQMVHFFALMLWIAAGLAFAASLPQLGVAIIVVVILNALFAFAQEYRAERAAEQLRDLLPRKATVLRDGVPTELDAAELVVDDLVQLNAGDRISADLHITEAHELQVDTSTLTGESIPAAIEAGMTVFAGTFVTEGEAMALVAATGPLTRLAGIAKLSRAGRRPQSPLAVELRRVVRTISVIAVSVGGSFFVVSLVLGSSPSDGFVFGVGVTVALVPEALLPTVTLSLAMGAQRMARRHALVRRLESVETLGSTTFICTDKTGTLTRNEMSVVEVWTPAGRARINGNGYEPTGEIEADTPDVSSALTAVARVAAKTSTGRAVQRGGRWEAQGDPMEAALDAFARRVGISAQAERDSGPEERRFPFDPRRRRMSLVAGGRVLVKGAPDAVLPRCVGADAAESVVDEMAGGGLRVLAIASRPVTVEAPPDSALEAESELELLGLIGLEDPPRPEAVDAIRACREAGIGVAMVTGDHPATSRAIARQVGLLGSEPLVVTGDQIPADDHALAELVDRDGIVIARVDPETKLRIARALHLRGHVLAMTGDGVNDGPALQEADVGVAMGRTGTDVAREASDLVLLDDNFATIVVAIEQGRAIFANARRFLTYHLTDNVAELTPFVVWALSGSRFPLALGVLQILALDIGTDTLPAVALGAEPAGEGLLRRRPERGRLLDRTVARRAFGILGPVEAAMAMAAFLASFLGAGWRPGDAFPTGGALRTASGAAFMAVVLGQMANAFACRSASRWPGRLGWFTNRLLVGAVLAELAITIGVFLLIPPVASVLGQRPPSAAGWAVAALSVPAVLAADVVDKARRARRRSPEAEDTFE